MVRFSRSHSSIVERANKTIQPFMAQVYGWMTCGLLLTAFVAWYAARTPILLQFIFSNHLVFFSLMIVQLVVVFILSNMVNRLSSMLATSFFMLYSALTGLTLASIFILYASSSIASTFVITSGMFGVMTVYGYTTKQDLTSFNNLLLMTLIGVGLASLVNLWLKSTMLTWLVTYTGVLLFVGLTAYDTQKLKKINTQLSLGNREQFHKESIFGALTLYLDFINLFLMFLRIFGNRR
ncbi:FtsH-interacting integral membrane protein [secondary endosymbiont of Heteropsylla cubana]|uniref:FtsH-interacting integral membrane protein n=1 Tax=secondary endosymbiont of Heteropsylla cubana TaxID=134287 RepID=J3YTJ6_9ENTR|nr:Bax inhibitor-1/YccA family protein [secondary endosymbiont of Heteropsylla cubana]AFP85783.1 FtsH-interacting integral membrane protein [secondary endosymbiont of Heteropsylla cubana]